MNTERKDSIVNKPTFEETVDKAARTVYLKTATSGKIKWELLPRSVQKEIRDIARTAITVALVDMRDSITADMEPLP